MLNSARHLLSSRTDAYKSSSNSVRHANKSQIISSLNFKFLKDAEDALHSSVRRREAKGRNVCSHYDYPMQRYVSVMFDLMNHIWSRGTYGTRRSTVFSITFVKMEQLNRPWYSRMRAQKLKQVHLHVDDPGNVIKQKHGEQPRRDSVRDSDEVEKLNGPQELQKTGFLTPKIYRGDHF